MTMLIISRTYNSLSSSLDNHENISASIYTDLEFQESGGEPVEIYSTLDRENNQENYTSL